MSKYNPGDRVVFFGTTASVEQFVDGVYVLCDENGESRTAFESELTLAEDVDPK